MPQMTQKTLWCQAGRACRPCTLFYTRESCSKSNVSPAAPCYKTIQGEEKMQRAATGLWVLLVNMQSRSQALEKQEMLQEPDAQGRKHPVGDRRECKPDLESDTFASCSDCPDPWTDKALVPDDNRNSTLRAQIHFHRAGKRVSLRLRDNKLITHMAGTEIHFNQKEVMLVL